MSQNQVPPSDAVKADAKVRFDFIARVHVYTHDYIRFADTKASAILAACGFLFSGLFTRGDALGTLIQKSPSTYLTAIALSLGAGAVISLAITVGFCVACIKPRLGSTGTGLVYWDQIANNVNYADAIANLSGDEAVKQVADHVKVVSGIAQKKYGLVSNALWCFCATLALALLFSITLIWMGASISPK